MTRTRLSSLVFLATLAVGCSLPPVTRSTPTAIRQGAPYRAAVDAFRSGNRAAAQQALARLLAQPGLTATDRAFLERQQALVGNQPRSDCGPLALQEAARLVGVRADLATLTTTAKTDRTGTSLAGLLGAARGLGLKAIGVQVNGAALAQLKPPAVAWWDGDHFVCLQGISPAMRSARLYDPRDQQTRTLPLKTALARSGGIFLVISR